MHELLPDHQEMAGYTTALMAPNQTCGSSEQDSWKFEMR